MTDAGDDPSPVVADRPAAGSVAVVVAVVEVGDVRVGMLHRLMAMAVRVSTAGERMVVRVVVVVVDVFMLVLDGLVAVGVLVPGA